MIRVIGVDPGPIPGFAVLNVSPYASAVIQAEVLQCTAGLAPLMLGALTVGAYEAGAERTIVALEEFVVGNRAAKSAHKRAGSLTRTVLNALERDAIADGCQTFRRTAAQVKPWATDARLEAVGLLDICTGMRHARDAARHALFAAVHDVGLPDPLSNRSKTSQTTKSNEER